MNNRKLTAFESKSILNTNATLDEQGNLKKHKIEQEQEKSPSEGFKLTLGLVEDNLIQIPLSSIPLMLPGLAITDQLSIATEISQIPAVNGELISQFFVGRDTLTPQSIEQLSTALNLFSSNGSNSNNSNSSVR